MLRATQSHGRCGRTLAPRRILSRTIPLGVCVAGPCAVQAHLTIASREAPVEAPPAGVTLGQPRVLRALHRIGFGVICGLCSFSARIVAQELPSLIDFGSERYLRIDALAVWADLQEDSATPVCFFGYAHPGGRREEGGERDGQRNHGGVVVAPAVPAPDFHPKGSLPLRDGPFGTAGTGAESGARPARREAPCRMPEAQLEPEPFAFARIASRSIFGH